MEIATTSIVWAVIVTTILATVAAEPKCAYDANQQRKLVCKATDDKDYVLRRGLVSDSNLTKQIVLIDCKISDIEAQAFENLPEVESIDLNSNRIRNLKLGVFDGARKIYILTLSYNLLTDIPSGLFTQLPNLRILSLEGNRLTSGLKRGTFDGLPTLYNLFLANNVIKGRDFDPSMFGRSNQLRTLTLNGNDMSNSPDNLLQTLKKLKVLTLDSSSLTEVPKFATAANLRTLVTLTLSTNRISRIDDPNTFNNLNKLELLTLSSNLLESINENVFKQTKKLLTVRLDINLLKTIPEQLFQGLAGLFSLDLKRNLIEFIPPNAFKGSKGLKYLDLSFNRISYLSESFFLELRNSGVFLVSVGFTENPWQCACLKEALLDLHSLGQDYNGAIYDGKKVECVTTSDFKCRRGAEFNQFYLALYNLVKGGLL